MHWPWTAGSEHIPCTLNELGKLCWIGNGFAKCGDSANYCRLVIEIVEWTELFAE